MAKNDYFTIVYKLLAILYDNLKDGVKTDLQGILNDRETFPIVANYWIAIFEDIIEKGYVKGVIVISKASGGKVIMERKGGIRITADGVEYLENNSLMKKALDVWGTAKEFLPVTSFLFPH